jgi:hypothetical protein
MILMADRPHHVRSLFLHPCLVRHTVLNATAYNSETYQQTLGIQNKEEAAEKMLVSFCCTMEMSYLNNVLLPSFIIDGRINSVIREHILSFLARARSH